MAHIGHELALGAAGGFGRLPQARLLIQLRADDAGLPLHALAQKQYPYRRAQNQPAHQRQHPPGALRVQPGRVAQHGDVAGRSHVQVERGRHNPGLVFHAHRTDAGQPQQGAARGPRGGLARIRQVRVESQISRLDHQHLVGELREMVHHGGFNAHQLGIVDPGQCVLRRNVRGSERRGPAHPPQHRVLQDRGERPRGRHPCHFHVVARANLRGNGPLKPKSPREVLDKCGAARIGQGQRAANANPMPLLGRVLHQVRDVRLGDLRHVGDPRPEDRDIPPARHE